MGLLDKSTSRCSAIHIAAGRFIVPIANIPQNVPTYEGAYSVGAGFFAEVKIARREVNHSPLSRAEAKNEWSHTAAPPPNILSLHGQL